MNLDSRKDDVKASQFYALMLVALTGILGMVSPPDLALMNAQAQTTQNRKAEADRLLEQGNQQFQISQFEAAFQTWQQALTIYREIKDRLGEGQSLGNVGLAYYFLGRYDKAIKFYLQSLAIAREIKDRLVEGQSLGNLGLVYYSIGKYEKAIEFHLQRLAIAQEIKDPYGEGQSLGNLGLAYYSLGKYEKAIEFHLQSLAIAREIKDRNNEGASLGNLGIAYYSLGKYEKAIEFHRQDLAISRENKNRLGEGQSLGNLGLAYYSLGIYDKAIDFYLQRLAIAREINDPNGEGAALGNLGLVYYSLGKYDKAIDFHLQRLAIAREIKDRSGEGKSAGNLGIAYDALGKYEKAIEFFLQSLAIAREIKDPLGEGQSLGNLGIAYRSLGKYDKAIEFYLQSLAISQKIKDRLGEGQSLGNLGNVYRSLGKYDKAIESHQQHLAIAQEIKDRDGEGISLNNLGLTFKTLKQPELAILFYKQSINVREAIRKDITKLDKDLQKSYLETISSSYKILADLLIQQDRVIEALQVLDLLKVQELEDYLKNIKGSNRSAQGVRLLEPERELGDRLLAVSFDNSKDINKQLANQIQQLPKSEINKVPDYLNQIPNGTVLLYPFILEDRLEIILFSSNNLPIRRTTKISQEQLSSLINDFRSGLLDTGSDDYKEPAAQLYKLLIKPIEAELIQFNAKTILYAPDGQLRYIPIAALHDGNQWLIERYRINNITASSLTNLRPRTYKPPKVLAAAATNSQNIKLGDRSIPFGALPATKTEVEAIATLLPNTTTFIDQQFNKAATIPNMQRNNIVHLATHGYFAIGKPEDSFIVFGDGDKATISDIGNWSLTNVALVVLSACETAIGGKLGNGIEILGLGYQIQTQGAGAAIASLWKVSDNGTSELMQALYKNLSQKNISSSEALRQAQITMIRSDKKGNSSDRGTGIRIVGTVPTNEETQLSHPFYWSAFILIGNGL